MLSQGGRLFALHNRAPLGALATNGASPVRHFAWGRGKEVHIIVSRLVPRTDPSPRHDTCMYPGAESVSEQAGE